MLVIAVLGDIITNNPLNNWFKGFWGYQVVATLNNHCKNFRNLIFVMTIQISQQVGVKLQKLDLMSSNHPWNKTEHKQLNLVFIIAFLQFGKQFLNKGMWVVYGINRQEVCAHVNQLLSQGFSLNLLDSFFKLLLSLLRHFGSLSLLQESNFLIGILISRWIFIFWVEIVIQN